MVETSHKDSNGAPFNMAISTLMRLSEILTDITKLSTMFDFSAETRQGMKVNLIKQFFSQATPLLKPEAVKEFMEQVLNLKSVAKPLYIRKGSYANLKGAQVVYSPELEIQLDTIIINLQIKLQEQGYFMPPKNDPRYSFSRE